MTVRSRGLLQMSGSDIRISDYIRQVFSVVGFSVNNVSQELGFSDSPRDYPPAIQLQ
jgi:hypothetical protein